MDKNRDGVTPGEELEFAEVMRLQRQAKERREATEIPVSPEDVDKLAKPQVKSLLADHGVEMPGANVADMRAALKRVLFVDEEQLRSEIGAESEESGSENEPSGD